MTPIPDLTVEVNHNAEEQTHEIVVSRTIGDVTEYMVATDAWLPADRKVVLLSIPCVVWDAMFETIKGSVLLDAADCLTAWAEQLLRAHA